MPIFWKFKKDYSEIINKFSIIFRVDGKFSKWEEKGINRMRLIKKLNYITIDIGITEDVLDLSESEIWNFIWLELQKATNSFLEKFKKVKVEFKKDFLIFIKDKLE